MFTRFLKRLLGPSTPMLDAYSEDLTRSVGEGRLPDVIGREREIEEVFRVLEGGRESVVLVGPPGVGKGSVLFEIARVIRDEGSGNRDQVRILNGKRVVRVSIAQLVCATTPLSPPCEGGEITVEMARERFILMLDEVTKSRNSILAFPDLHLLDDDLSILLVEWLTRNATFAIGTTTPQDFTASIDRGILGRMFQRVVVREPDVALTTHILASRIAGIESEYRVVFDEAAVRMCVTLSDRYLHETYLPQKAIDLAHETAWNVLQTRGENVVVTEEDVVIAIANKTGLLVK